MDVKETIAANQKRIKKARRMDRLKKIVFYFWAAILLLSIIVVIFAAHFAGWEAILILSCFLAAWVVVPVAIVLLQDRFAEKKRMGKYWKDRIRTNPAFGEVEYQADGWRTVEKRGFPLFDRIYSADVLAMTKRQTPEEISALQESAYRSFLDRIVSRRAEIEQAITNHFNEVSGIPDYNGRYREGYDLADIPSRFVPSSVEITRKGECAIFVSDDAEEYGETDDWDEGFVITIVPEIQIHSKEEYQGYVSGSGNF